ncbi:protein of unknown function [Xenorhabdus poinarii G6]|uniref:Uncharacterized protein n=1 Tax=Xenorhabdus poinarii G6 TaxID=1354304 RepID=A0A068R765_9GAMM|nr:protein of unknown function [Xenorhabdus poinarii G6]
MHSKTVYDDIAVAMCCLYQLNEQRAIKRIISFKKALDSTTLNPYYPPPQRR